MEMLDLQAIIKSFEVKMRMARTEIVRAVQRAEGNTECFRTGEASKCGQDHCRWMPDCD